MKQLIQSTSVKSFQTVSVDKKKQKQIKGGNTDFVITEDWLDI